MIRASKHILKYANSSKIKELDRLFDDYAHDLQLYVNNIISGKLPFKKFMSIINIDGAIITHSQWKQIIYKNAYELVKSNITLQSKRRYNRYKKVYSYFKKQNKFEFFTSKKFSELKLNSLLSKVKIDIKNISIAIDSRRLTYSNDTLHFNEFIGLKLPYFKENRKISKQINLPIKWHKHSLKYINWKRKNTILLNKINGNYYINFIYEGYPDMVSNNSTNAIGIDIGYKKLISDSNGNFYGTDLEMLYNKIARKQRGSKNYKQSLTHKKNKINEVVNEFMNKNTDIKYLIVEDLKSVKNKNKFNKKFNNKIQYWSYKQVLDKLKLVSEERDIILEKVSPFYTSQMCSKCGIIDKDQRIGEIYQCICGNIIDADYNASINILHRGSYSTSNTKNLINNLGAII